MFCVHLIHEFTNVYSNGHPFKRSNGHKIEILNKLEASIETEFSLVNNALEIDRANNVFFDNLLVYAEMTHTSKKKHILKTLDILGSD